ncbi:hypothetical protein D3C72_1099530 [compost metagenome]
MAQRLGDAVAGRVHVDAAHLGVLGRVGLGLVVDQEPAVVGPARVDHERLAGQRPGCDGRRRLRHAVAGAPIRDEAAAVVADQARAVLGDHARAVVGQDRRLRLHEADAGQIRQFAAELAPNGLMGGRQGRGRRRQGRGGRRGARRNRGRHKGRPVRDADDRLDQARRDAAAAHDAFGRRGDARSRRHARRRAGRQDEHGRREGGEGLRRAHGDSGLDRTSESSGYNIPALCLPKR